jgi:NADPH:quinone reductase-like Zn-dependent oxidoreductase
VKAVVYHGPRNVSVDEVPDAKIEKPTDALVRITATNICGSDLHMYEGRTGFKEGRVFGHENVGEFGAGPGSASRVPPTRPPAVAPIGMTLRWVNLGMANAPACRTPARPTSPVRLARCHVPAVN